MTAITVIDCIFFILCTYSPHLQLHRQRIRYSFTDGRRIYRRVFQGQSIYYTLKLIQSDCS